MIVRAIVRSVDVYYQARQSSMQWVLRGTIFHTRYLGLSLLYEWHGLVDVLKVIYTSTLQILSATRFGILKFLIEQRDLRGVNTNTKVCM